MDLAQAQALSTPLTAAEHHQVQRGAAAAGQTAEDFARDAILDAATDPFLAALEQAVETIASRDRDMIRHDYAD
ncbi:hypothetical protein [Streptomyces sp. A30]|uniref:hypothetical protein n=1 Tax=Streptomyces sp. A30 TaxID=2789273 RepID=UPI0039810510